MDLPCEIQEKIIGYLNYDDLVNYSNLNKTSIYVCDHFLIRKCKLDNIPTEFLPKANITKRYIQLYNDRLWFDKNKSEYSSIMNKLTEIITNDDYENRIKWLCSLVIKSNILYPQKIDIIMTSCYFAFRKDKNNIVILLLSILRDSKYVSLNINNVKFYLDTLINYSVRLSRMDICYFILENFLDLIPDLKCCVLSEFAKKNDLDNINNIINNYTVTPDEYVKVIVEIECLDTLDFLLQKYQGDKSYLSKMIHNNAKYQQTVEYCFFYLNK